MTEKGSHKVRATHRRQEPFPDGVNKQHLQGRRPAPHLHAGDKAFTARTCLCGSEFGDASGIPDSVSRDVKAGPGDSGHTGSGAGSHLELASGTDELKF